MWNKFKGHKEKVLFVIIVLIGILTRLLGGVGVFRDIQQDEAYAAYEAYSILNSGVDSWGYTNPVYLTTWGSGMSVLNTYLMIPFILVFGFHTWVIRLPQFIVACLTILVVFSLVCEFVNKKVAFISMFLLVISPWHIFLSSWGLDCNLAPGFLMFGLYFFTKGLKNSKFLIVSAIMYGLSLYCYATIWPFVPIIILLQTIYALIYKKIKMQKEIIIAGVILFMLALPLMLFLLVNNGYIEEIKTSFISIPKLLYIRSDEFGLKYIVKNFNYLCDIITEQLDDWWGAPNAPEKYGIFYHCTLSFFFLGLYYLIKQWIISIKCRQYNPSIFILIQLIAGFLLGITIHVKIHRVNIIFIPMIIISAVGVFYICEYLDKKLYIIILAVYIFLFARFEQYFIGEFRTEIAYKEFDRGLSDTIEIALEKEGTIYVTSHTYYTKVLYYSKLDVNEFIDTVKWTNYPSAYLIAESFGRFVMYYDNLEELDLDGIYVLDSSYNLTPLKDAGYKLETFGYYTVAYYE